MICWGALTSPIHWQCLHRKSRLRLIIRGALGIAGDVLVLAEVLAVHRHDLGILSCTHCYAEPQPPGR